MGCNPAVRCGQRATTMAYVAEFENDLFVSYAHLDDRPLPPIEKGWVTQLMAALRAELGSRLGCGDSTIWRDVQLEGNQPVTSEIIGAVRSSAVLILVLSPGYLASEWCRRERNEFLRFAKAEPGRVFVVERLPVDRKEKPPELQDLNGYQFWEVAREGKPARTLGTPQPRTEEQEYYDRVVDLAVGLAKQLKKMRTQGVPDAARVAAPAPRPAIFLAETTDDLDGSRATLRRYLEQAEIEVLPREDLPSRAEDMQTAVDGYLRRSKAFVQLLGPNPGKRPPDLPQGRPRFQYECAVKCGLPIVQWRDESLVLAPDLDPAHRDFLMLETVRAEGLVEFGHDVIKLATAPPADTRLPASPAQRIVFVELEPEQRQHASVIFSGLPDATFMWPAIEDNKEWRQAIADADGVLVVWANDPDWAARRWSQCHKRRSSLKRPMETLAIYDGPPPNKAAVLPLAGNGVTVINGRQRPAKEALAEFVARLRRKAS